MDDTSLQKVNKPGIFLTLGTLLLVILNVLLVFINESATINDIAYISGAASGAIFIPAIITGLFCLSKKNRNQRSQLKIFFWSSFILLIIVNIPQTVRTTANSASKAPDTFVVVQSKYQNEIMLYTIKKVPHDVCEETLNSTAADIMKKTNGCTIQNKKCFSELPDEFKGVFENKKIGLPYLALDGKYQERYVVSGMTAEMLDNYCLTMKKQYPAVLCVY